MPSPLLSEKDKPVDSTRLLRQWQDSGEPENQNIMRYPINAAIKQSNKWTRIDRLGRNRHDTPAAVSTIPAPISTRRHGWPKTGSSPVIISALTKTALSSFEPPTRRNNAPTVGTKHVWISQAAFRRTSGLILVLIADLMCRWILRIAKNQAEKLFFVFLFPAILSHSYCVVHGIGVKHLPPFTTDASWIFHFVHAIVRYKTTTRCQTIGMPSGTELILNSFGFSGTVFHFYRVGATQKVSSFCVQSLLPANRLSTAMVRMATTENINGIVMTCAPLLVSFFLFVFIGYAFSYRFSYLIYGYLKFPFDHGKFQKIASQEFPAKR